MISKVKRLANKSKIFSYIVYIIFNIYGMLTSILFLMMKIFPVKKNKIVGCNMKGKRYGDSPKYIMDEILKQKLDYELVWLIKPEYKDEVPKGVKTVNYNIFNIAYELSTSRFWIDSNTLPLGCLKRKNQYYIHTWHGSPFKKIGGDIPDNDIFDIKNIKNNSRLIDLIVSNCRLNTEIFRRAFWYDGEMLECGTPRNDIFFQDPEPYINKVRNFFRIQDKKIALYAPTFRKNLGTDAYNLDFELLRKNLKQRFGGEWVVLVRLHPYNIADAEKFIEYTDNVINATGYSGMQELLAASEVVISDYSGALLDFSTKKGICFMYATDIAAYIEERDVYYDVYNMPFPLSENNEELERNILDFDEKKYEKDLLKLFDDMGLYDNGSASSRVVEWIVNRT